MRFYLCSGGSGFGGHGLGPTPSLIMTTDDSCRVSFAFCKMRYFAYLKCELRGRNVKMILRSDKCFIGIAYR